MPDLTLEILGLDEVRERLAGLGRDLGPEMQAFTHAVAEEIEERLRPYPPMNEGNFPHPIRGGQTLTWYERGWGQRYTSSPKALARYEKGNVTGKTLRRWSGGKKTSEQLGQQWSIKPYGQWGQILGNRASYSATVQGAAEQAAVHKKHGWKTDETAVQEVIASGVIRRLFNQMIRHFLGR